MHGDEDGGPHARSRARELSYTRPNSRTRLCEPIYVVFTLTRFLLNSFICICHDDVNTPPADVILGSSHPIPGWVKHVWKWVGLTPMSMGRVDPVKSGSTLTGTVLICLGRRCDQFDSPNPINGPLRFCSRVRSVPVNRPGRT